MFLAREGSVHDVADALFLARSVWKAGIRDVHRAEDHAEVGIDRPVSPVADFRNLRIRSAITSAPDDRLSFSSGLGSIPSGSLGLWFLRRPHPPQPDPRRHHEAGWPTLHGYGAT